METEEITYTIRTEKHVIQPSHKFYDLIDDYCHKSKNLYNFANYHIRQAFTNEKDSRYINYFELDKLMKQPDRDYDYRQMPSAASAQQCLRSLDASWRGFFRATKDWAKNKSKYTGQPKLPNYLDKDGYYPIVFTKSEFKIREDGIHFPKTMGGFILKSNQTNIQQVRFIAKDSYITAEVVYRKPSTTIRECNNRLLSIDIGINNLATITNNFGSAPIIINGRPLKSINQYYNKQLAHYRSINKKLNGKEWSKRLSRISTKRNNLITNYLHRASKQIIDYAVEQDATTLIIGNNKDWKRASKMSRQVNQQFVGIPHQRFIEMLVYKGEDVGINVILQEESYTSGTSFLDDELPVKENYNKKRRKKRGLFISNDGTKINADVNASLQIMKKVRPDAFNQGIQYVKVQPVRVNVLK